MKLLEVRGVKLAVDGREILHGVNLEVGNSETVVIVGKNGAGKSSIAGVVMGIFGEEENGNGNYLTGEVKLGGKEISTLKMDERARMGVFMSYQAPVEIPGVDMREMLWAALEARSEKAVPKKVVEEKILEAVKQLNADAFTAGREVNVGASGGERLKNELLQMLVLEPKLAILDEIDSGLDVDAAKEASLVLSEYQKKTGAGLLIITHNMRILESLRVTKVYLMEDGRIVKEGGREVLMEVEKEGFKNEK